MPGQGESMSGIRRQPLWFMGVLWKAFVYKVALFQRVFLHGYGVAICSKVKA